MPEKTEIHQPRYLSPAEYALSAGLSLATVWRYLKSGKIPSLQPGGRRHRVLIPVGAVTFCGRNPSASGDESLPIFVSPPAKSDPPVASPGASRRSRPRWKS